MFYEHQKNYPPKNVSLVLAIQVRILSSLPTSLLSSPLMANEVSSCPPFKKINSTQARPWCSLKPYGDCFQILMWEGHWSGGKGMRRSQR